MVIFFISFHLYLSSFSLDLLIFSFIFFFIFSLSCSLFFSLSSSLFHLLLPSCHVSSSFVLSCLLLFRLVLYSFDLFLFSIFSFILSPLSSLFSLRLVLSCLVLSCLPLFRLLFSLFLCLLSLSSFSMSLSVSPFLSPCDVVLSLWSWLWSWCCWCSWCVFGVRCGTLKQTWKYPYVDSDTPSCTPREHVFQHILNVHTETFWTDTRRGHRQFCLPKFAHVRLSLDPRGSPKKPLDLTRFQFENRSRTTRCHLVQSSVLPDKDVQLQLS